MNFNCKGVLLSLILILTILNLVKSDDVCIYDDVYIREDCGEFGTTPEECINKGCCWGELEPGTVYPWCFYKIYVGDYCDYSEAVKGDRIPCDATDEASCEGRGCCWGPLEPGSTEPWCFYKNTDTELCCPEDFRTPCDALYEDDCKRLGCCWYPLEEGSPEPWCFNPNCPISYT